MMDLFKVEQLYNSIVKKEEHILWLRSIVDSAKVKRPLTKAEWKMGLHPDQVDAVDRVWLGMIISMTVVMGGIVVAAICYR